VKKAVLFDLDGVLVDACDLHYQALNWALAEKGFEPISHDKHLDVYNGLPTMTKLHLMGLSVADSAVVNQAKQAATVKLIESTIKKDKGKIQLLQELRRMGCSLACVTNCSPTTAALMLSRAGLLRYISVVVTNADVQDPKPSPEGYKLAMTRLVVQPKDCVVVEDSPKGIMAGKASGASVISVRDPSEVTIKLLARYIL
jgi:beta-phosphoglucomutase